MQVRLTELGEKVQKGHMELNDSTKSEDLFAKIENELLQNKEKYPLMYKYYNPDK